MNIREQIEKEITEKVMTKLASERVELGLVDDLKKLNTQATETEKLLSSQSSDLSKLFQEVRNIADEFNGLNDQRNNEIKKGKAIFKELNSKLDAIQKQAKDLGLAPKDIPNFSKSVTTNSSLRAATNDYQRYSNIKI